MNKKKFVSINAKLTLYNAILVALIIFFVELLVYTISVNLQIEDTARINKELVETISKSFDDMNSSLKKALNFVTMDTNLQELLIKKTNTQVEYNDKIRDLSRIVSTQTILLDEIFMFYLFDEDGNLLVSRKKRSQLETPDVNFDKINIEDFSPQGDVTWGVSNGNLVFKRKIRNMQNLKTIGYLIVLYDQLELKNKINTVVSNDYRFLVILDNQENIITHNYKEDGQLEGLMQVIRGSNKNESYIANLPGFGRALITQYNSDKTGYRTISAVATNQIILSSKLIIKYVLFLGILGISVCIFVQWLISRKIVGPLNKMVKNIQQAYKGNFASRMEYSTNDELDILANAFNEMLEKTDTLVNQVLRDSIKFQEMQMRTMQAQINPHILYNTLECINWLAEFGRKDDIRSVTIAFSDIMKSLVSDKKDVTLEKEIKYVKDFLSIYKIMLGDKLEYTIDIDERALSLLIPRLTLQPIIENAVLNGIKKSMYNGIININVSYLSKVILISVSDNGVGMNSETVEKLTNYINNPSFDESQKPDGIGIGIQNVSDRLYLKYQGKSRINIYSKEGFGTTVDISIPFNCEENGDDI